MYLVSRSFLWILSLFFTLFLEISSEEESSSSTTTTLTSSPKTPFNDTKPPETSTTSTTLTTATTTTMSTTTITTTGNYSTFLAPTTSIHRTHHGKKELLDPPPISSNSSDIPLLNTPTPFTDDMSPVSDSPTSVPIDYAPKNSLIFGLIFGVLLCLTLSFLVYKRIDAIRRRREYRRMNDYLIDGMYNEI